MPDERTISMRHRSRELAFFGLDELPDDPKYRAAIEGTMAWQAATLADEVDDLVSVIVQEMQRPLRWLVRRLARIDV